MRHFVLESSIGVADSSGTASVALRASGMACTIIRPSRLTNDPATGDVLVGEGGCAVSDTISRADVARVMLVSLLTPEARNRTFEVVSRAGQRGAPGSGLVSIDWRLA